MYGEELTHAYIYDDTTVTDSSSNTSGKTSDDDSNRTLPISPDDVLNILPELGKKASTERYIYIIHMSQRELISLCLSFFLSRYDHDRSISCIYIINYI